jgi:hypothetical protein
MIARISNQVQGRAARACPVMRLIGHLREPEQPNEKEQQRTSRTVESLALLIGRNTASC